MLEKSFAGRLSLKIMLMTSAVLLLSTVEIAVRGSRMTHRDALTNCEQALLNASSRIETSMHSVEQIANSFSESMEAFYRNGYKLDTNRFYPLLGEMLKNNPYILGCGVYYEPYRFSKGSEIAGIYVVRNHETGEVNAEWTDDESFGIDGWSPFGAKWYEGAVKTGEPIWIPPFLDYLDTGEYRYMTTYAVPLRDAEGNIFGVCSFDMSLDWLRDALLSMKPYPGSRIAIFNKDGDYICNPRMENPYQGNVYDSELLQDFDYDVRGKLMEIFDWEDLGDIKMLDQPRYGYFTMTKDMYNGWQILITNLYKEAFRQISIIWLIMGLIALFGLTVMFFISRRIIYRESHPLVDFADAAGKITGGRFDVPIPTVKHEDEISALGDTLRYMQKSISDYIDELTVTTAEKERLAGELDVAHKIQKHMLSTVFPTFRGGGISASSIPARQVGGDLYDFYLEGDTLCFILGDVSGKGVPAALMMAISISAFRAAVGNRYTMAEIMGVVNSVFCHSNEDMMFITIVAGKINLKTGEMEVCNAGHNPMVLIPSDGQAEFLKLKSNMACGIIEDFDYQLDHVTLPKDSRLLVYTDGVTEAEDSVHGQYGEDRLLEFARSHGKTAVTDDSQVITELLASVSRFVGDAEQFDDITMMSMSV